MWTLFEFKKLVDFISSSISKVFVGSQIIKKAYVLSYRQNINKTMQTHLKMVVRAKKKFIRKLGAMWSSQGIGILGTPIKILRNAK